MNYQSPYQSPLNSVAYQFQNMGIRGSSGVDPSLLGTQSSSSPFVAAQQYPSLHAGHASSLINGWGDESGRSSPYPSQLGTPSMNGSHTNLLGPQMGVSIGMPPLESQWRYIDTQGAVQGPFGSLAMSQWYASGYFQHTLQICRIGTTVEPFGINDKFITLGDLIAKVSDFQDPFGAFDRLLAAGPVAAPIDSSLLKQQQHEPVAKTESGDFTHDEILQLKDPDGGFYREVVVQVPVSKKRIEKVDLGADANSAVSEVKEEKSEVIPVAVQETTNPELDRTRSVETKRQQKAEEMAKKLLKEQEAQEEERRKKEESRKLKKQQKQASKQQEQESKTAAEPSGSEKKNLVQSEITIESTAPKAPVAPWANKTQNVESPRISIAELHKREDLEQAKRDQERERAERVVASQLQKQILKEEKTQKDLKSVLTWASKPAPPPVSVEIQPPQPKKGASNKDINKKSKPSETLAADALKDFNNPSFIEEQTKLWEKAQREKALRAASTTTTTTHTRDDGKEWTTITTKASNATSNVQPRVVNQPKSYISPDKLRVVGGTSHKQIGSFTTNPNAKTKSTAPAATAGSRISHRQDFLRWCRSQMKLNKGVEVNSVLEVLLSLPAGSEAKEIIADTIYSNSSTMDGRRFATEFIKRRVECERLVKDPLTWSEALALPEGTEDDWEFQVVSKKKGRKNRAE